VERTLKPRHIRLLAEKAVSLDVAKARGYWSLDSADDFPKLGWASRGRNAAPKWLRPPGLTIPLFSPVDLEIGEIESCYSQFRPDRPVEDDKGKTRKYVNPSGTRAIIDVHPAFFGTDAWTDRDTPLFIVEGVPKEDALWSIGIPAVSIQGVWNFTSENPDTHYREILQDFRYLPVAGREVVIGFDADAWTNRAVRAAARELGRILGRGNGGASAVRALRLPHPEKKWGVDDFLADGGTRESLLELIVDLDKLAHGGLSVQALSEIAPMPPECLWEPYLIRNTLGFLDGAPGVGKTWIALSLAAAVTTGGSMPSAFRTDKGKMSRWPIPKGNVVYITHENDPSTALRPRFDRLGGDASKFFVLATGDPESDAFTLQDIEPLEKMIEEIKPVLVVLDPIMNFLGAKTDAHRDNEVRPLLSKLMRLASNHQTTMLGIRHLRKDSTGSAVYAAGGSVAFSGTARSVIMAGRYFGENESEKLVLAHSKTNETPAGASLEFAVTNEGKDDKGFYNVAFEWRGVLTVRADELVSQKAPTKAPATKPRDKLANLLVTLLAQNPNGVPTTVVATAMKSMELAPTTLKRVAEEIRIQRVRVEPPKGSRSRKSPYYVWKYLEGEEPAKGRDSVDISQNTPSAKF